MGRILSFRYVGFRSWFWNMAFILLTKVIYFIFRDKDVNNNDIISRLWWYTFERVYIASQEAYNRAFNSVMGRIDELERGVDL